MELDEIQQYIKTLMEDEVRFKNISSFSFAEKKTDDQNQTRFLSLYRFLKLIFCSTVDFADLYLKARFNKNSLNNKKIVYTARNFCNIVDGKLEDRVLKPLFTDDIIFINTSKVILLDRINNQKVYNIGGLVKFLSLFDRNSSQSMRLFKAYSTVNDLIIKNLNHHNVYILFFYDLNSLSLIFSKFRENINLIEVQHGSIINYPPYVKPAPVKIADVFYVKNKPTIEYLKSHLCVNHPADEYRLIPYPKVHTKYVPGIHILYASTVEFNGLHPVMQQFLDDLHQEDDLELIIRLHPREKEKEPLFANQLEKYKVHYRFDHSKNWLEGNSIENLIVVSPWSSTIEDSHDNNFLTIIIDPVGRERYKHLIDNDRCFYSDNLKLSIGEIIKHKNSQAIR